MNYSSVRERMQRARTPMGAVPISAIYGYEYPLRDLAVASSSSKRYETSHTNLGSSVDYMVNSSRAISEARALDPYNLRSKVSGLSFLPSALEEAHRSRESTPVTYKAGTPLRSFANASSLPPADVVPSYGSRLRYSSPSSENRSTTIAYGGTTPWNSTGFSYSPRYPQSYRGTASTTVPYSRRYPARRFVPSYVPIRYTRRY